MRSMQCEWKFLDSEKPSTSGGYLVLWSEPYSEKMSRGFKHYDANRGAFDGSPAGANEVLFWLDGADDTPNPPREGVRTRLVK